MNYNNPAQSGRIAFLNYIGRDENPVSRRTHANAHCEWLRGWDEASKTECKYKDCNAIHGFNHSKNCKEEHDMVLDIK
tara:strand:+ start:286 stop:519 length:234 start_codon:yes stop_codon:yes gene_type:complete